MKKSVIATHAVSLAISTAVMLAIQGCGQSKQSHAAGSSLPRTTARQAAVAVSLLTSGTVCEVEATGSMLPTFDDRAIVILEKCTAADVRAGDIIVRKLAGRNIVHRAISNGPTVRTRGDALTADDEGAVSDADLVGRAVGVIFSKEGRK